MVQILEDQPNFASQLTKSTMDTGSALVQALMGERMGQRRMTAENEAFKRMGMDLSGITDPELRKVIISETLKSQNKQKKEDTQKFSTGLDIIDKMRQILAKGNVGRGSSIMGFFPGETQRDRGELEQLGKSLIPLVAAGVPIRNQKEFEEYKKVITDPSSPMDRLEGALSGLQTIFEGKLNSEQESLKREKMKFNPNNPEHKAKAEQLHKTYKNKEKVREILKREFEGL